ncbi:hypothetical protein [Brotaphodocola sp.]|uniref:hypothetical protein n=1 Tax=Brotaphodocola sp. TaxID=3073577 RepID=UPI003D7C5E31
MRMVKGKKRDKGERMRKKKLWKQKCAMGLAVAVTATSVPTPALAGKTEVPVANEAQALEDKPEALKNVDEATSSDADEPDDQYDQEKAVSKATSSNAEEADGDGDLIDDVTVPEEPEKATASDAEQPEEEELLPVEQTQIQPAVQAEKKLNENATIDVWDDMTEEELKEELNSKVWGGDENDTPDTWYYQATGLLVNTVDWVKIEGETLKKKPNRITMDVVYLSLLNTVKNNSVTSVKIGINATKKSIDLGNCETRGARSQP